MKETLDILLVTGDDELRERVRARLPLTARAALLHPNELPARAPAARQVWLDLDYPDLARSLSRRGARRVYFHSQPTPPADTLPTGLFLRKPCPDLVLDVLLAGALTAAKPTNAPPPRLPAWVCELQELNLRTLCRGCVARLPAQLGYATGSLYLYDESRGALVLAATSVERPLDTHVLLQDRAASLMAAVVAGGRALRTTDAGRALARRGVERDGPARPYADGVCLVAPLRADGVLHGVLNLTGRRADRAPATRVLLRAILPIAARALANAREHETVRTEARVDGLTGLFNRRWMSESLEREVQRAARFHAVLSVLMLDLDGLKQVNDAEGHAAGDGMLRHVAERIRAALRQTDAAARVGGDEFVVVLPGTDAAGAQHVARRLLESIRTDPPSYRGRPLPVTASVGAAQWQPGWDAVQLVEAADRAMYAGKREGGDRLILARDATGALRIGPATSLDGPTTPAIAERLASGLPERLSPHKAE